MKKVAFLVSHLYSGSAGFSKICSQNPRVEGFDTGLVYDHPFKVETLLAKDHKCDTTAAVYMDELLYNYSFCCRELYGWCKFIYVVREPKPTLNGLVTRGWYKPDAAWRYYCYRLRRMCEMAKYSGGVLLTWDDLMAGEFGGVEKYLNLKTPLVQDKSCYDDWNVGIMNELVEYPMVQYAQAAYARYLKCLRSRLTKD
jgi:hypothetical protein